MRPGLILQLWFRRAPRWQVGSAAVAVVGALALLASSFSTGRGAVSTASSGAGVTPGALPSLPASGAAQGAAGAGSGGVANRNPQAGGPASASAGQSASGPAVGASSVTGQGSGGTAPSAEAAGGGPAAAASGGPAGLTATDRGVTAGTIKLGFSFLTLAGLENTPAYENFRTDGPQYAAALASYQNTHGGVLGRKIQVVSRKTDPLDHNDQISACTFFTQDQQVFSVIDPTASLIYYDVDECFTQQNSTPLIHELAQSYAVQARTPGYDISTLPVYDRISKDEAAAVVALGVLHKGEKVGVLEEGCQPEQTVAQTVLVPALKEDGAGNVVQGVADCTADGLSQVASIVTQFKLQGVSLVISAADAGYQEVFQTTAGQQQYKPTYFESDWANDASNAQTRNYTPSQFDGTMGVTSTYDGTDPGNAPLQLCSKIAVQAGLPPLTRDASNDELVLACDDFFLFVRAAEAAGADLTRARWAAAVTQQHQNDAYVPYVDYRPNKFDGPDQVQYVQWHASCSCWKPISGWMPSVTLS